MIARSLLRIKVLQLLYAYTKQDSQSLQSLDNELTESLNNSNDLFHTIFQLVVEIKNHAAYRIELGKKKNHPTEKEKNPNTRFIDNPIFALIENSIDHVQFIETQEKKKREIAKRKKKKESVAKEEEVFLWTESIEETPRKFYDELINSSFYKDYMNAEEVSFNDHKRLVLDIIKRIISKSENLYTCLEEMNIYWNDDAEFVVSIIQKNIKKFKENVPSVRLKKVFPDPEELQFAHNLLQKTVIKRKDILDVLKANITSWDLDRIADIDLQIMTLAIGEILEFPNIPIKVSLDEYIDLAKAYGTSKSGEFVNGVLDKTIKALKADNQINKAGRGLK